MARRLVHFVMHRPLEALINSSLARFGVLPIPQDSPVVHAPGADPDRILLIGTGVVRGQGVTSNQLGVGGQLARRLPALTGRGVDMEMASSTSLVLAQAAPMLEGHDISRFDAIVFMMGLRDAFGLTGLREWRRDMRRLLETASRVPQVFVIGIPDIRPQLDLPASAQRMLSRHTARLNDETRAVVAETPGVEFIPFTPDEHEPAAAPGSVALYEGWTDYLAPAIASRLDPTVRGARNVETISEQARQRALDALGVVGSGANERLDGIARMARDLLGASGASVTFLDHDRQWIKSAVSVSTNDMARMDAFCNTTISKSQVFVVEDATEDDQFAQHPWVVGDEQVRFYAGYPLEARGGVRVGALCVVDTKPRHFSPSEAALLRELALQVQEVLWAGLPSRSES